VLASHAFVLTGHDADEPIARLSSHLIDGGGLAVAVFFVLSGFLIARSASVHPPGRFLRARVLRIYPAFLVAVVVQTLILGPVFTSFSVQAYLLDPTPWGAMVRAVVFSAPPGLPGVFADNPLPSVVNGSLWTLRIEALCYIGLLALAVAGLVRRGWVLLPLAVGWVLLGAVLAARAGLAPAWLAGLRTVSIVDCILHFLMGAAFWVYAPVIPMRGWLAGVAAIALMGAAPTAAGTVVLHIALPYIVLWVGLARPWARRLPDISYGTYLYAFPIQQALVARFGIDGPYGLMAWAMGPTLLLAVISYQFIERPALRLKTTG
jgi:peptidoglycan/LPS O-acetylase OafA/YrhL